MTDVRPRNVHIVIRGSLGGGGAAELKEALGYKCSARLLTNWLQRRLGIFRHDERDDVLMHLRG